MNVCTSVRITAYAWVEGGTRNAHITAEGLGFRVSGLGCRTYQEGAHACNLGRVAKAAKRDHLLDLVHAGALSQPKIGFADSASNSVRTHYQEQPIH